RYRGRSVTGTGMPPWGGCGFPTIVSLYSANTALRITPGILPESVGVVKRKCRLDPPTAFAAVGRVQRPDQAEGQRDHAAETRCHCAGMVRTGGGGFSPVSARVMRISKNVNTPLDRRSWLSIQYQRPP